MKLLKDISIDWRIIIVGVCIIWFGVLCFGIKTTFFQEKQQEENSLIFKIQEPDKIKCDKCGKLVSAWSGVGFSIQNIDGIPDMTYCYECVGIAIIWLMDNSFTMKKVKK